MNLLKILRTMFELGAVALLLALAGTTTVAPAQADAACRFANTPSNKLKPKQARPAIRCVVNSSVRSARDLRGNQQLKRSAQFHTRHMARSGCIDHVCPGHPSLSGRVKKFGYLSGYGTFAIGEVIAKGSSGRATPRDIVRLWMGSPPHRGALLSGTYRNMGVGVVPDKALYTVVLGMRKR